MRYEIVLSPEAEQDYRKLSANARSRVRDSIESHLRHEPMKTSKSGIKRLRGIEKPR